jgi:hypothetical protein
MNIRNPIRGIGWKICAATMLCAAAGVSAQRIYKDADADGRITYADRPGTPSSSPTSTIPARDVAHALAGNVALSSRHSARVDTDEAARRLRQALDERSQGAGRLASELADGSHAAEANLRYRARQESLQREVEQAVRRAGQAGRALRAQP